MEFQKSSRNLRRFNLHALYTKEQKCLDYYIYISRHRACRLAPINLPHCFPWRHSPRLVIRLTHSDSFLESVACASHNIIPVSTACFGPKSVGGICSYLGRLIASQKCVKGSSGHISSETWLKCDQKQS